MKMIWAVSALALLISAVWVIGCTDPSGTRDDSWNLTLVWDDQVNQFSLADLKKMTPYSGHGYLVSTTGIRYGPFRGTGVPLSDLTGMMGEMNESGRLYLYGSDEYLWVLDQDQIRGTGYITFDENLSEIANQTITPVLMYEQDGIPLTPDDGGPVRLALLTEEPGVITEGSGWVKWVSRIELHR